MAFNDNINRLERIDNLIRIQATGSPEILAQKLGISKRMLYNDINTMKDLGAPISYNYARQTYFYTKKGRINFGVYSDELSDSETKNINGGFFFGAIILHSNSKIEFTRCAKRSIFLTFLIIY